MGLRTTRVKPAFVVLQANQPHLFLKRKVMTKEGLDFYCVPLISISCSVILHCVHTVNDTVCLLPLGCQELNNRLSAAFLDTQTHIHTPSPLDTHNRMTGPGQESSRGWCLMTNSLTYTQTLLPSQHHFQKIILDVSMKPLPLYTAD